LSVDIYGETVKKPLSRHAELALPTLPTLPTGRQAAGRIQHPVIRLNRFRIPSTLFRTGKSGMTCIRRFPRVFQRSYGRNLRIIADIVYIKEEEEVALIISKNQSSKSYI